LRRLIKAIGTLMVLVGLGLVALFLIGPPGGTAGSVPTGIETQNSEAPADGTLYLTIPKIGLEDVKVYDSLAEERLDESTIHLPETGFPWQPGANTYIAGHRMGFFGTNRVPGLSEVHPTSHGPFRPLVIGGIGLEGRRDHLAGSLRA